MLVVKTWFHQEREQIWIKNTLKKYHRHISLASPNICMCCTLLLYPLHGIDLSRESRLHGARHCSPGNAHVKKLSTQCLLHQSSSWRASSCCSGVKPLMELIFLGHPGTSLSQTFLWVRDMIFSQVFHAKNFMLHIVKNDWNRLCTHQNKWTFTFPIASYPWHPWKSLTSQLLTLLEEGEKGSSCKRCWLRDYSRKSTFLAAEERFIICSSWWNLIVIFIFCINLIQ